MRYLNPLPADLETLLKSFKHVLVPELNLGQLRTILRAAYLLDVKGLSKVRGQPFTVREIVAGAKQLLAGSEPVVKKTSDKKAAVETVTADGG